MTQEEFWLQKWCELGGMETDYRRSLKFIPEQRKMHSWCKHNNKLLNAGKMKKTESLGSPKYLWRGKRTGG